MKHFSLLTVLLAGFLLASIASAEPPERIEINKATLEDLTQVKGVGQKIAEMIIEYRDANGPIERMGQVQEVKGIGNAKLKQLVCFFYAEKEGKLPCEIATIRHGSGPVNLNTANAKELQTLPGIGKKKAETIVEDRTQNGLFHSVDDLQRIKGIGRGMVDKLSDLVSVRLDINLARGAEFELMGFSNGDTIIKYRTEHGKFGTLEDLKKVPGIDKDHIDKIAEYLSTK
ncbi:MAG: helix-hairpin-helix domain-containing protein [Pseudomonadota bacterium]